MPGPWYPRYLNQRREIYASIADTILAAGVLTVVLPWRLLGIDNINPGSLAAIIVNRGGGPGLPITQWQVEFSDDPAGTFPFVNPGPGVPLAANLSEIALQTPWFLYGQISATSAQGTTARARFVAFDF